MKEILISGYYGFKNSGDDALLSCIIDDIEKVGGKRSQIVVLSENPEETSLQYNVRAIGRTNIFAIISHMGGAGLLISGGGTLIQDGTSTKSILYYLGIIKLASIFGVKTMLYANGIGPIIRDKNKKRTKAVLKKVDMITLRDKRSYELLKGMGITKNVHVTADPVFCMKQADEKIGTQILKSSGVPEDKALLGVSVRPFSKLTDTILADIAGAVDYFCKKYDMYPVILPMQTGRDEDICKKLTSLINTKSTVLHGGMDIYDMLCVTSKMKLTLGMRLHTLIYSAVAAVPVIGLVYDPKVLGFMEYSGQNLFVNVEDIEYEKLCSLLDSAMSDYDKISSAVKHSSAMMRDMCEENRRYLSKLLERDVCEK